MCGNVPLCVVAYRVVAGGGSVWTHRAGVVHGAVTPAHVLVHPRDHGAVLVGWGTASARTTAGWEPLAAISRPWSGFYPERTLEERKLDPIVDVQMAARCALAAWGERPGEPKIPEAVTGLSDVVRNPIYATGVGLLQFGHRNAAEARRTNVGSGSFSSVLSRMKSWFQGNF